jgi:hypothetical protein
MKRNGSFSETDLNKRQKDTESMMFNKILQYLRRQARAGGARYGPWATSGPRGPIFVALG